MSNKRPCLKCGRTPTPEGYDACLGHLDGVEHACCGHGLKEKVVVKKTFLECMFNVLDDISDGTDEEVIEELEDMGIDIDKARSKFLVLLKRQKKGGRDE